MPLPKPRKGESQDDFVSRCVSNAAVKKDFDSQKQRLAVCFEQFSSAAETPCCDACAEGHTCTGNSTTSNGIVLSHSTSTGNSTFVFAAKVIEETIAGEKYLSFPIVMAVEGVRQAANSPAPELILRQIFEPAIKKQQTAGLKLSAKHLDKRDNDEGEEDDKLKRKKKMSVKDWQLPLVFKHPQRGKEYVSVKEKHDASTGKPLGYIDNVRFEGKKLVGQAHMSMKLVKKAGEDAILQAERIKRKNLVEVSLGHSARVFPISGRFKGKSFYGIHMSPLLDHLALLGPMDRGACSVKDGCGTPRD